MEHFTIPESAEFAIWFLNFEGQLRKIYETFQTEDEGQVITFEPVPFMDFCLMMFETNPEAIDYSQN